MRGYLNGFVSFRTRESRPTTIERPSFAPCLICGKRRHQYSPPDLCFTCDDLYGPPPPKHDNSPRVFTQAEKDGMVLDRSEGMTFYAIGQKYGCDPAVVSHLVRREGESGIQS